MIFLSRLTFHVSVCQEKDLMIKQPTCIRFPNQWTKTKQFFFFCPVVQQLSPSCKNAVICACTVKCENPPPPHISISCYRNNTLVLYLISFWSYVKLLKRVSPTKISTRLTHDSKSGGAWLCFVVHQGALIFSAVGPGDVPECESVRVLCGHLLLLHV